MCSIVKFHGGFEKIYPFKDCNGRVGRFIMLKQCIENNNCLIGIDEKYNDEYKNATYEGQKIIKSPTVQSIYDVQNVKMHVLRRR
ncbi:Fic family protein [Oceanirhabdus seepicola]|uniref:Fic family protein n=2 Tax=Oceanirhabdus seepicola TaxID=2828781 RepID=A0A9J6P2R3_9CLOT|nr:Fic family protein [Oceanirhabdus seepicola]